MRGTSYRGETDPQSKQNVQHTTAVVDGRAFVVCFVATFLHSLRGGYILVVPPLAVGGTPVSTPVVLVGRKP